MEELENLLQTSRVKKDWKQVSDWVLAENQLDNLIQLFLQTQDKRISQQAAAVFMTLVDRDKNLFYPYQEQLVQFLENENITTTQQRNIFRLFQFIFIREEVEGELLNESFKVLENPTLPIAVRVFAMTVAARLAERYPEIIPELRQLIEMNLELGPSAGFVHRAKRILKSLNSI